MRARYRHVENMCEHTFDNSPIVSNSSSLNEWSTQSDFDNSGFCLWNVFFLGQKTGFMHKRVMTQRLEPSFSNAIFIISVSILFDVPPCRFVSFNNACTKLLSLFQCCLCFGFLLARDRHNFSRPGSFFTRHCRFHLHFHFFRAFFTVSLNSMSSTST